jgi:F-type H+-transporting ATPase subunit epsilon
MPLPAHLALEIVTPDRAVVHDNVDEVQIPGTEGYLGVLPGHTPLLTSLQVGQLWYRKGTEKTYVSVAFGFAEVMPDRVVILAQIAERAEEIDVDRAQSAKQRAEQRLASPSRDLDLERARVALMKAMTRLNVATRARTRG